MKNRKLVTAIVISFIGVTTVWAEAERYSVGDLFDHKGEKLTYVASGEYTDYRSSFAPNEGNKYIFLDFYVENDSNNDMNINPYDFNCYADGYECQMFYYAADDFLSANLSPGRFTEGKLYFEIPIDAQEVEIEYDYDWMNDNKAVFLYEGEKDAGFVAEKTVSESDEFSVVGDTVEVGGVTYSFLSKGECEYNDFYYKEGFKNIYIELEVENHSGGDEFISMLSFNCFADGKACESYYGMDDNLSATISDGRKAKGTVAFSVPENASIIEVEYEPYSLMAEKIVFSYSAEVPLSTEVNEGNSSVTTVQKNVVVHDDRETILMVQAVLNAFGYDCGTPDGNAGPEFIEALHKYQQDKGLTVSDQVTDELLDTMGL